MPAPSRSPAFTTSGYVNAYQAQSDQVTWWERHHPSLLLRTAAGRLVIDPNWGEPLLDTATASDRAALATIVGGWFAGGARSGFQAVEPDNLDSFTRSDGRLTLADNLAYARLLAERAHAAGRTSRRTLAENSAQVHPLGSDFAIAEQCRGRRQALTGLGVSGVRDATHKRICDLADGRRGIA